MTLRLMTDKALGATLRLMTDKELAGGDMSVAQAGTDKMQSTKLCENEAHLPTYVKYFPGLAAGPNTCTIVGTTFCHYMVFCEKCVAR